MEDNNLFYCYSKPLKRFFVKNGEKCIEKSVHFKTNKTYWVFKGNLKLNSLLKQWRTKNF